jgi:hypothetical protein
MNNQRAEVLKWCNVLNWKLSFSDNISESECSSNLMIHRKILSLIDTTKYIWKDKWQLLVWSFFSIIIDCRWICQELQQVKLEAKPRWQITESVFNQILQKIRLIVQMTNIVTWPKITFQSAVYHNIYHIHFIINTTLTFLGVGSFSGGGERIINFLS